MLFRRSSDNPILTPNDRWWESRAVLNPGTALYDGRVAMVYRAVGTDGISRFGLAWSGDGVHFERPDPYPFYEAPIDDPTARLGVEDPRLTPLGSDYYVTYTKACTAPATTPKLAWETAPFRVRSVLGVTRDFQGMDVIATILPDTDSKDSVLFPEKFAGRYALLIREFPSIQYLTSEDLHTWSEPKEVMAPVPGTWEAERIGAGPPPLRIPWGWLLLYHANEYLRLPNNERMYRMGLAVLDAGEPWKVLYRHPEPIFVPEAPYEMHGPVGNVVFGEGLVEIGESYYLYYGAGDGVIGLATAARADVFALLTEALGGPAR
ncbi:MAG TPA: glycosidase [Chloroflexota bacterium]|nr:glycosidase [Chloroflexota bacterium]